MGVQSEVAELVTRIQEATDTVTIVNDFPVAGVRHHHAWGNHELDLPAACEGTTEVSLWYTRTALQKFGERRVVHPTHGPAR